MTRLTNGRGAAWISGVVVAAACVASTATTALAQHPGEAGFEESFKSRGKGRGDQHSPGWLDTMRLKGGPVEPRIPKLGDGIERYVLENGLVVYLAPDHRLPLVRLEIMFRGGDFYESEEDWGTASFSASQMRDGGTMAMAPDDLDDRLAFLAASISTGMGDESGSASLDVMRKDFDEGLKLFSDVLMKPAFNEERMSLAKKRRVFALLHQNDDPGGILRREVSRLMYGKDHPRGRQMTPERVNRLTREDLVRSHRRFFRPNNAWLAAVGDFEAPEMLEKLRGALGGWEKGEPIVPSFPTVDMTPKAGVYLVDRPINQSTISIGHLGINRDNPDRFAIALMNDVLGGGSFSSRITERVRSDEGLAYHAGTRFDTGSREVGLFEASVQTKTETTAKAIDSILDEIKKMRAEGATISKNEFETARESTLFSYVFRFEDLGGNVARLMRYEMEGRPADSDRLEFEGYRSVTPTLVEAAARNYLRPDALTIFVVGDASKIGEPLKAFGPVTIVPLKEFSAPRDGGAPGLGGGGGN